MGINEEKANLRAHMRQVRDSITPVARKKAEDALAERLYSLPSIRKARVMGVYQAVGSEVSVADLVRALRLLEDKPRIAYPAVCGEGVMKFAYAEGNEAAAFIRDPIATVNPAELRSCVEPQEFDILLVPGLAFDESCWRLGQGGGYYDRYLEHVKSDCLTIGVAFDEQVVDAVPYGVHDRRVDYVITPTRTLTR